MQNAVRILIYGVRGDSPGWVALGFEIWDWGDSFSLDTWSIKPDSIHPLERKGY
ncbi:MAG: hypothetical protein M1608_02340 [Candidatus Omnitrophica bacterium]|nr:hypothetical protein [Candidatus Omnitrophota bacterium]